MPNDTKTPQESHPQRSWGNEDATTERPEEAPQKQTNTPWLDTHEAAAYLKIPSAKALRSAVSRGQVPAHRVGRRLRFHRDELDRAILGNG